MLRWDRWLRTHQLSSKKHCEQELEGIVAKRLADPYGPGQSLVQSPQPDILKERRGALFERR
jgi:hypothetical protein